MKNLLCFFIVLIDVVALAQLPPYVRNPVTTNGPVEITNVIYGANSSTRHRTLVNSGNWRIVSVGDSLTVGVGNSPGWFGQWISRYGTGTNLVFRTNGYLYASSMITNYADAVQPYKPAGGTNALLFFEGGINDLSVDGIETVWQRITNYWALAKADGFTLCAFTIADNLSMPSSNRLFVDTINMRIKASTVWDYCVDMKSVWKDVASATDCLDGVHWSTNACIMMAEEVNESLKGKKPALADGRFLTSNLHVYDYIYSGFIVNRNEIISTNGGTYRGGWYNFRAGGSQPSYMWGNASGPIVQAVISGSDLIFRATSAANLQLTDKVLTLNTNGIFSKESYSGRVTATNGYFFPTNPISAWPIAPRSYGETYIGNSNGILFMLESHPSALAWVSTNALSHQPRWNDCIVSGMNLRAGGSSPQRTLVIDSIYGQGWNAGEDADFTLQLPHGIAITNAWFPNWHFSSHLHVSGISTNGGTNVAFAIAYQYAVPGGKFGPVYYYTNWVGITQTNTYYFIEFSHHTNNALSGADSLVVRGNIRCLTNNTGSRVIVDSADFHIPVMTYGSQSTLTDD